MKILNKKSFSSKNTAKIAKDLIGKFLVRRSGGKTAAYMITEVEAYDGFKDKASHAHRGITERNKIMFGEAGHWYVYFTYGMHFMLNLVTGPIGYPAAILIRGIEGIHPVRSGLPQAPLEASRQKAIASKRGSLTGQAGHSHLLKAGAASNRINGPARLTKKLKIDKKINGLPASKISGLWLEDGGIKIKPSQIKRSSRIGVDYAGPVWAKKKLRFFI